MRSIFLLGPAVWLLAACSSPAARSPLLDPDSFGNDMGTLISIADVRTVAEEMVESMNASDSLSRLRGATSPLKVLVGDLRQYTTVTNFDKRLFMNRLITNIQRADLDHHYSFFRRDPVVEERELQQEGKVAGGAPPQLEGADWVLGGEIREILVRAPHPRGGEVEKRTVQYTLQLTRVADASLVWSHSHEVVKRQLIGAVYR